MKKIAALLLAAFLLLSLAACSGGKSSPGQTDSGQNTEISGEDIQEGYSLIESGDYQEAVDLLTDEIKKDSNMASLYVLRGDAYTAMEMADEALSDYADALKLDATDEDAYLGAVNAYILKHDFESALSFAEKGQEKTKSPAIDTKITELKSGNIFDTQNRQHKLTHYLNDEMIWYHIISYRQDGNIYSKSSYDAANLKTGEIVYKYDDSGNNIFAAHYYHDNGVVLPSDRKYDAAGNCIEMINWGAADCSQGYASINMKYNEKGQKIYDEFYGRWPDEFTYYSEYEYNSAGKLSKRADYHPDGSSDGGILFEYGSNNQKTKQSIYDADGKTKYYYTYEYDSEGNLIEETRHE